jgi:hypothetical protein
MAKVTIETAPFQHPAWPQALLKPGTDATLKVDAPKIKGDQHVEFRIRNGADLVDVVVGAAGQQTATWKVPNLSSRPALQFDALLKQKPTPQNGFHAVLNKATSPPSQVTGFTVSIGNMDGCFVPHAEMLHVAYTVADVNGVAQAGRVEVWGERYPTNKPVYFGPIAYANGVNNWNTWNGTPNDTKYGAYLTPEFSPYRLRIIVGPDQGSVDDPFGAGLGKVAVAEKEFEVKFESVNIRIQVGITETASGAPANAGYTLAQALAIEPYNHDGTYAHLGRLPTSRPNAEVGRIRIPMACHQYSSAWLDQGGLGITDNYFSAHDQAKRSKDGAFYNRPEIPIEFELHLRSRDLNANNAPNFGVFDKEVIGPAKLEPYAEDTYLPAVYDGNDVTNVFWRKSVFKIKKGTHKIPVNSGNGGIPAIGIPAKVPVFDYWQYRKAVPADGTINVDLDNFDANDKTYHYEPGKNELTIYLNRTRLVLGKDQAALDKGQADYIEVDYHSIKLRSNFTKANDILWIVRVADGVTDAPDWNVFPPGTNCHRWYGGVRGSDPTNGLLKKGYSAPVGTEPVIGKINGAYAYETNNFINLKPAPKVPDNRQERVEVSAIVAAGNQQGLAGVLFSPSFTAGDSYTLHAYVDAAPYERNLGWVEPKPAIDAKTGRLTVWRVMTIAKSIRLPNKGSNGLAGNVGTDGPVGHDPETLVANRAAAGHIGDGRNMDVAKLNTSYAIAFNEWTIKLPIGPEAPAGDPHKDANLATYRGAYNGLPLGAGKVNMNGNGKVRNEFIPYDHYRVSLPKNFPPNRLRAGANKIATLPQGLSSITACVAVRDHINGLAADDPALNPGVQPIPVSPLGSKAYEDDVKGIVDANYGTLMDALTPQAAQPKVMQVIRWPKLYDYQIVVRWIDKLSTSWTTGFSSGNSQSFFETHGADSSLFGHEMGHSVDLMHFVAGNFCYKHHHLLQADCMMSYDWKIGFIVAPATPAGPTGGAATVDTGWPHTVPNPLPDNSSILAGTPAGATCIQFGPLRPAPRSDYPCAKCALKLRGWQEERIPCAWKHPDLF